MTLSQAGFPTLAPGNASQGSAKSQPGRSPPAIVQGLVSSSSHHALSDTQPYLPFSLPKATKPSVPVQRPRLRSTPCRSRVQAHLSLLCTEAPEAWQAPQPKRVQALPVVSISGSRGLMFWIDSSYLPQICFFRVTLITAHPEPCSRARLR